MLTSVGQRARDDLESILTGLMKRHADVLARSFQDFIVARIATGVDAVFAREDVRLSDAGERIGDVQPVAVI